MQIHALRQFARLAALLSALALPSPGRTNDALEATLADKAQRFRDTLVERHLAPEGIVLYRLDETRPDTLASGVYPELADTPTFTGLFAATSCLRARVEGDASEEARSDAERALSGLRFLMDVTGSRGLFARGVRRSPEPQPSERGRWFAGSGGFSDYRWRGDVSFDQYANGLLPAVAECRELLPEVSRRLVVDAAHHLLAHDFRLVDPDGRQTRFGDLSWRAGAGLNSISQLTAYAIISFAAELDPDPRWLATRDLLRDRYLIPFRSRITNLRVMGITNHSNDLMVWNLYRALVPLARATADRSLPDLRHGVYRSWLRVRGDGNAYFAAVLCGIEPLGCDRLALDHGLELLARFPLDKHKRAPREELDTLARAWLPGRKLRPRARLPVPIELRPVSSLEWKSSPYRVTGGVAPEITYTGLDYLSAYWLYRALEGMVHGLGS